MTEPAVTAEDRLHAGDLAAAAAVFASFRDRLKKMVRLRLDRRLQGRLDASDVLQDAFMDVQRRLPDFAQKGMLVIITEKRSAIITENRNTVAQSPRATSWLPQGVE